MDERDKQQLLKHGTWEELEQAGLLPENVTIVHDDPEAAIVLLPGPQTVVEDDG